MRRAFLLAVLVTVCVTGCPPTTGVPDEATLTCEAEADCPAGWACLGTPAECVSPTSPCVERLEGTLQAVADGNQCTRAEGKAGACLSGVCRPICGDGLQEAPESCDHGGESALCNLDCTLARCGDGVVNYTAGESCDDAGPSAVCNDTCTFTGGISAGADHTCALMPGGRVKCWGSNLEGQLGIGARYAVGNDPGEMGAGLRGPNLGTGFAVVEVSGGERHTCARSAAGAVKCWGDNAVGQLGQGDTEDRGDVPGELGDVLPPVELGTGRTAQSVSAGRFHTCALLDDGRVKCWGENITGQLGQGHLDTLGDEAGEMGDALPAVALDGLATAVVAGDQHSCAILEGGVLKCWGESPAIGLGDANDRGDAPGEMGANLPPVNLGLGEVVTQVGLSYGNTCAVLATGAVKCWGVNYDGRLGTGDLFPRGSSVSDMGENLEPIPLGTGARAVEVALGIDYVCARLTDTTLKCWGNNDYGELGHGDTEPHLDPATLGDALSVTELGEGALPLALTCGRRHCCVRLSTGAVKCWGGAFTGTLGLEDDQSRGDDPGEMGDALPALDLGD